MHCLNRVKINLKRLQNMKLVVVVQAVRVQLHYLKNIGLARGQTMGILNCVSKIINFHTAYRRIGEEEKGKFVVSCYSKKTYLIDRVCFFFHWDPTQIYTIKILKPFLLFRFQTKPMKTNLTL